ncbi:phosphotransferase family protein [Mycobacterium intracellulare]|uniref:phosphotransferase family protein n=1 Tax=Mycobacterium intracellulare TaxID=1767 RepID=UPI003350957F
MSDNIASLTRYLDARSGDSVALRVQPMRGGGSCEIFAVDRGSQRWVLRRAPAYSVSATAHDVLREFTILDAIKDQEVPIARPVAACADPNVFGAPFYLMQRIDGVPIRNGLPAAWVEAPALHGRALELLIDTLVAIHRIDWRACGLGESAPATGRYLERQIRRWTDQLHSYAGRDLPAAEAVAHWLDANVPAEQGMALCHGDYKLDNVLFAPSLPPALLAVVDWEMAGIGDPLVDLAWALIFHPEGTIPLGVSASPAFAPQHLPSTSDLIARYQQKSGRDTAQIGWYAIFARWKLAIALEGSYAKFRRGQSRNPVHEAMGKMTQTLLADAENRIGRREV